MARNHGPVSVFCRRRAAASADRGSGRGVVRAGRRTRQPDLPRGGVPGDPRHAGHRALRAGAAADDRRGGRPAHPVRRHRRGPPPDHRLRARLDPADRRRLRRGRPPPRRRGVDGPRPAPPHRPDRLTAVHLRPVQGRRGPLVLVPRLPPHPARRRRSRPPGPPRRRRLHRARHRSRCRPHTLRLGPHPARRGRRVPRVRGPRRGPGVLAWPVRRPARAGRPLHPPAEAVRRLRPAQRRAARGRPRGPGPRGGAGRRPPAPASSSPPRSPTCTA